MNPILKKITMMILASGTLAGPVFAVSRVEGQLEKITLEQCNVKKTKCIILKADKALGSQFSSLHVLSDIQIQVFDSRHKLLNSLNSKSGYLDPQLQRVVLSEKPAHGRMKETMIDLASLVIETKVMM